MRSKSDFEFESQNSDISQNLDTFYMYLQISFFIQSVVQELNNSEFTMI